MLFLYTFSKKASFKVCWSCHHHIYVPVPGLCQICYSIQVYTINMTIICYSISMVGLSCVCWRDDVLHDYVGELCEE